MMCIMRKTTKRKPRASFFMVCFWGARLKLYNELWMLLSWGYVFSRCFMGNRRRKLGVLS